MPAPGFTLARPAASQSPREIPGKGGDGGKDERTRTFHFHPYLRPARPVSVLLVCVYAKDNHPDNNGPYDKHYFPLLTFARQTARMQSSSVTKKSAAPKIIAIGNPNTNQNAITISLMKGMLCAEQLR
jgi:hypothetical protein